VHHLSLFSHLWKFSERSWRYLVDHFGGCAAAVAVAAAVVAA
jgi:hypothetical protein